LELGSTAAQTVGHQDVVRAGQRRSGLSEGQGFQLNAMQGQQNIENSADDLRDDCRDVEFGIGGERNGVQDVDWSCA
jgi:hypothetical protein